MKYETTESFWSDYRRLRRSEKELFWQAVQEINAAYARRDNGGVPVWPAALRVKSVRDAPGVFEMTWSFSGPDGRATFELFTVGGEPAIRWRRVGDHQIFQDP